MKTTINPSINEFYKFARLSVRRFKFPCQIEEDIVQDVVLKCWQKYENLDNKNSLNSWISTIARNACIDHYRKLNVAPISTKFSHEESLGIEESVPSRTFEISAQYESDISHIRNDLYSMEDGIRRKIAIGFYVEGRSVKDLSRLHSMKPNTILSHLRRMRLSFSEKFKKKYDFSYLNSQIQYCF